MKACGSLLEIGGDDDGRQVLIGGHEVADEIAAHIEFDLAEQQKQAAVGLRPARPDRDVEPVFLVGAVRERLIIAARLGIGEPVESERDLIERKRGSGPAHETEGCKKRGVAHRSPFGVAFI